MCIDLYKKMYKTLLEIQKKLLTNDSKGEVIRLLSGLEHDVLMLNNTDNSISRDLF